MQDTQPTKRRIARPLDRPFWLVVQDYPGLGFEAVLDERHLDRAGVIAELAAGAYDGPAVVNGAAAPVQILECDPAGETCRDVTAELFDAADALAAGKAA